MIFKILKKNTYCNFAYKKKKYSYYKKKVQEDFLHSNLSDRQIVDGQIKMTAGAKHHVLTFGQYHT